MKKTMHKMKRMLAALLAVACLPVVGLTARADVDWYWGNTTWDAFDGKEPVEVICSNGKSKMYYLGESEKDFLYIVTPRDNVMRFVLREDLDPQTATDEMYEILKPYRLDARYQGLIVFCPDVPENESEFKRVYELRIANVPEDAVELEANILHDLAKAHLVSNFYGWGATASYNTGFFGGVKLLTDYKEYYLAEEYTTDGRRVFTPHNYDWDAVQSYLDEHYPGYKVEQYESEPYEFYPDGSETPVTQTDTLYRIVPSEELSFREKFELAFELSPMVGEPEIGTFDTPAEQALGHNALENKGDVTLDLELDIMDVIAANKAILGSYTLCDTAKKNADISGDGTPDETDSLAILKEVVGITEGFVEQ